MTVSEHGVVAGSSASGKACRVGTHRTRRPADTVADLMPRMHEFGITRLADVTGLDCLGVPVYMAVRPNSRNVSVAQGKGLDRASAMASGLMEAIESWHAERVEVSLRYESYASLRRHARALDVTRLPLRKGARLRATTPLLWAAGQNLFTGELVWVPFECVSLNFVDAGGDGGIFESTSSGLASGNHRLEAIVHGLCEVIEADASASWIAQGVSRFGRGPVDLGSITDGALAELVARFARADAVLAAWDVTGETGIPAFAAQVGDDPSQPRWTLRGVFGGYGCHPDAKVALARAITEAAQSRLTYISGSRDDLFGYTGQGNVDDVRAGTRVARAHAAVAFEDRDLSCETLEGDVAVLLDGLAGAGVETAVVVDLSLPDVGIPVVKVVVPGLRPPADLTGHKPGSRAGR